MDFRSILTLEIDVFRFAKLKLIHQGIVLMGYLAQTLSFHRVDFCRLHVVPGKQDGMTAVHRKVRNDDRRIEQPGHSVACDADRVH